MACNKLGFKIRRSTSLSFRFYLLKISRPTAKPVYNIHNPIGLKIFTRSRHPHLIEHMFRHNFNDFVNPLCSYSLETRGFTLGVLCYINAYIPRI